MHPDLFGWPPRPVDRRNTALAIPVEPSIRLWKADNLAVVRLLRYRLASGPAAGSLTAISRLLPVLSTQPQLVSVSGCPSDVIPVLDESGYFSKGIQYPFRFDVLSLPTKNHQRWGSVFGGNISFSQLRLLITFLDSCQDQVWAT